MNNDLKKRNKWLTFGGLIAALLAVIWFYVWLTGTSEYQEADSIKKVIGSIHLGAVALMIILMIGVVAKSIADIRRQTKKGEQVASEENAVIIHRTVSHDKKNLHLVFMSDSKIRHIDMPHTKENTLRYFIGDSIIVKCLKNGKIKIKRREIDD